MSGKASKRPRQQRAMDTRERLLDAAEILFDEVGYSKAGMGAIAKQAGVSVGGLYEWFGNKDEILTAVALRHVERVGGAVIEALDGAPTEDLESLCRSVLRTALAAHSAHPRLHRFLYAEAPRPPALQAKLKQFDDGLEALIAERLASTPASDPETVRLDAALIARAGQALLHDFVLDDALPKTMDERLDLLVRFLMGGRENR